VISIDPQTAAGQLLVADYGQPPYAFLNGANGAAIGTEATIPLAPTGWLLLSAVPAALVRCRRRRAA
jgi:hypothetical protein